MEYFQVKKGSWLNIINVILRRMDIFFFILLIFLSSCAYFNTFYNAQQYFKEAEKEVQKSEEITDLKKQTVDALQSTIDKCNMVIEKYPESKFTDDALLLMGKAHFYKGEFSSSMDVLERLISEEETSPLVNEAELWLFQCKCKLQKPDIALEDTRKYLQRIKKTKKVAGKKGLLSLGHKIIANIFLESGKIDSAIKHYESCITYLRDNQEKAIYYYKIAELAFDKGKYDIAERNYRIVINNSNDPDYIEKSHLQIIKILRFGEEWEKSIVEIQNLITNEKFNMIRPDLYLELAKLYEARGEIDMALSRLSKITEDFQRSEFSAEAYYLLGILTLKISDDFDEARKYYESVEREKKNSIYAPSAKVRVKEIDALLEVQRELDELYQKVENMRLLPQVDVNQVVSDVSLDTMRFDEDMTLKVATIPVDTVSVDSTQIYLEIGERLYSLGELLAFHFDRSDTGLAVFRRLINDIPESPRVAQAMYSVAALYRQKGDTLNAILTEDEIIEQYPNSEYAEKIAEDRGEIIHDPSRDLLRKAELVLESEPAKSIQIYEMLIEKYPDSRFIPHALYSIAYQYETRLLDIDRAIQFYSKLMDDFPESDQAKFSVNQYHKLTEIQSSLTDTTSVDTRAVNEN